MSEAPTFPPPSENDLRRISDMFAIDPGRFDDYREVCRSIYMTAFGSIYSRYPNATPRDGWWAVTDVGMRMLEIGKRQ